MRDYKFRGKRVDNGEWVYGCLAEFVNYLDGDTKPGIQITEQVPSGFNRMIPAFETELVEVIPESVGQYTGLHDKKFKEIYEGDVTNRGTVEYWNGTFQVMKNGQCYDNLCWCYGELEVIGNRFDNPSLLEVQL